MKYIFDTDYLVCFNLHRNKFFTCSNIDNRPAIITSQLRLLTLLRVKSKPCVHIYICIIYIYMIIRSSSQTYDVPNRAL